MKEQILALALARFNQQGVGHTTVRHLTTELGIGLGHFSYYFRKKEDLIFALYLHWMDELAVQVQPFIDGTVAVQFAQLLRSVRATTRLAYRYRFLLLDWVSILRTVAPVRQHFSQYQAQRRQGMARLLAQLIAEGYYRPLAPQPQQQLVEAVLLLENFWILHAELFFQESSEEERVRYGTELYFTVVGLGFTAKGTAAFAQAQAGQAPD